MDAPFDFPIFNSTDVLSLFVYLKHDEFRLSGSTEDLEESIHLECRSSSRSDSERRRDIGGQAAFFSAAARNSI